GGPSEVGESRRSAAGCLRRHRSFDGWALAGGVPDARRVNGTRCMGPRGFTRIDGRSGLAPGPRARPPTAVAWGTAEGQRTAPGTGKSILSPPPRSPQLG